jgi:hypothetical protein
MVNKPSYLSAVFQRILGRKTSECLRKQTTDSSDNCKYQYQLQMVKFWLCGLVPGWMAWSLTPVLGGSLAHVRSTGGLLHII